MAIWKMALVGLNDRDKALLETTIDLASGLATGRWEIVDAQDSAQVILSNIDEDEGKQIADNYAADQTKTLVIPYSASNEIPDQTQLCLAAPLSYKNITSLLKSLETELVSTRQKAVTQKKSISHESVIVKTPDLERSEVSSPAKEDEAVNKIIEPASTSSLEQSEPVQASTLNIDQINPADIVKHKIDWLSEDDETDETPILMELAQEEVDKEIQKPTSVNPSTETFKPESRILGLVMDVIEAGKTSQITHANYPTLRIFPDNGWFIFEDELDSFPKMFREPAESFTIESLDDEIKDELYNGHLPQSLWKLLFTAALFGSEGRLLANLNYEKSFHLMHTPYFGMIPHTADHISVAEFMVENTEKLDSINTETSVDLETIIDFCNACSAIQLLQNGESSNQEASTVNPLPVSEITALENDTTIESEIVRDEPQPKKSGLFNSLWSSLTKT